MRDAERKMRGLLFLAATVLCLLPLGFYQLMGPARAEAERRRAEVEIERAVMHWQQQFEQATTAADLLSVRILERSHTLSMATTDRAERRRAWTERVDSLLGAYVSEREVSGILLLLSTRLDDGPLDPVLATAMHGFLWHAVADTDRVGVTLEDLRRAVRILGWLDKMGLDSGQTLSAVSIDRHARIQRLERGAAVPRSQVERRQAMAHLTLTLGEVATRVTENGDSLVIHADEVQRSALEHWRNRRDMTEWILDAGWVGVDIHYTS